MLASDIADNIMEYIKDKEYGCGEEFDCDICPIRLSVVNACPKYHKSTDVEELSQRELLAIAYQMKLMNMVLELKKEIKELKEKMEVEE